MGNTVAMSRKIAAFEKELDSRIASEKKTKTSSEKIKTGSRDAILAEIEDLEEKLACGESYMDDEELFEDGESFMEDEVVVEDSFLGSEEEPGIEDEITQDYLSEVIEEVGEVDDVDSELTMLDVAPTETTMASRIDCLKSASTRLDKVANYLEKQGHKALALRIDRIADAVDSRIAKEGK